MLDCIGNELSVGDKIIAADGKQAELLVGEVIGFTKQKVKILAVFSLQQNEIQPSEFLKYPWQVYKR